MADLPRLELGHGDLPQHLGASHANRLVLEPVVLPHMEDYHDDFRIACIRFCTLGE